MSYKRVQRLREDYRDMLSLAQEIENFTFSTDGVSEAPQRYKLEFRLKSVVDFNANGYAIYGDVFRIYVFLHKRYPLVSPLLQIVEDDSYIPFHPHFEVFYPHSVTTALQQISDSLYQGEFYELMRDTLLDPSSLISSGMRQAVWTDYKVYHASEKLTSLIRRVICSLQYETYFISPTAPKLGNMQALKWYMHMYRENPYLFPTDNIMPVKQKKSKSLFKIKRNFKIHSEKETKNRFRLGEINSHSEKEIPKPRFSIKPTKED